MSKVGLSVAIFFVGGITSATITTKDATKEITAPISRFFVRITPTAKPTTVVSTR